MSVRIRNVATKKQKDARDDTHLLKIGVKLPPIRGWRCRPPEDMFDDYLRENYCEMDKWFAIAMGVVASATTLMYHALHHLLVSPMHTALQEQLKFIKLQKMAMLATQRHTYENICTNTPNWFSNIFDFKISHIIDSLWKGTTQFCGDLKRSAAFIESEVENVKAKILGSVQEKAFLAQKLSFGSFSAMISQVLKLANYLRKTFDRGYITLQDEHNPQVPRIGLDEESDNLDLYIDDNINNLLTDIER